MNVTDKLVAQRGRFGRRRVVPRVTRLIMRPLLGTPFRKTELTQRIADLLPTAPPPPLPVDLIEAFGNNWLELWYQPKIDPRALTYAAPRR